MKRVGMGIRAGADSGDFEGERNRFFGLAQTSSIRLPRPASMADALRNTSGQLSQPLASIKTLKRPLAIFRLVIAVEGDILRPNLFPPPEPFLCRIAHRTAAPRIKIPALVLLDAAAALPDAAVVRPVVSLVAMVRPVRAADLLVASSAVAAAARPVVSLVAASRVRPRFLRAMPRRLVVRSRNPS